MQGGSQGRGAAELSTRAVGPSRRLLQSEPYQDVACGCANVPGAVRLWPGFHGRNKGQHPDLSDLRQTWAKLWGLPASHYSLGWGEG